MTKKKIARIHPIAKLFPMMPDEKLAELAESIRQNGLLTPITRDPNGVVLDGRNRLEACKMAGVEPRFQMHKGNPVDFILAANITRRHLTEGQCAIIIALAYPDPEKCGRGRPSQLSKLEGYSASRLSEARTIIKHSRDLAQEVIAGSCTFKQALDEATVPRVKITHTDPLPYGTPTKTVTPDELQAAAARHRMSRSAATLHPNELRAARHRSEIENARDHEALAAHFAQLKNPEPTEPQPARMKDPVEKLLFDWEDPERLGDDIVAAGRLKAGYAQRVRDRLIEKMRAPPPPLLN
jgi:hypothetical protein